MLEVIFSDMDGTLLDENLVVPQGNIDAIMQTYQLGIPFVVCTGRNFKEAKIPLDEAGIRCPIIGLNGAVLFSREGEVEYEISLSDETALKILDYGYENDFYMEAMTSKNVYSSSKVSRIEAIINLIVMQNPEMSREEASQRATQSHEVNNIDYRDDLRSLILDEKQPILKISFIDAQGGEVLNPIADYFMETLDDLYITSSFYTNIEISSKDANKGAAVRRYCEEHGYNLENAMTIGDNLNDLEMLESAGYSYAMANGEDEVKNTAKYSATSNYEEGVGHAIRDALKRTDTPEQY